jgi:hypothetical protein
MSHQPGQFPRMRKLVLLPFWFLQTITMIIQIWDSYGVYRSITSTTADQANFGYVSGARAQRYLSLHRTLPAQS